MLWIYERRRTDVLVRAVRVCLSLAASGMSGMTSGSWISSVLKACTARGSLPLRWVYAGGDWRCICHYDTHRIFCVCGAFCGRRRAHSHLHEAASRAGWQRAAYTSSYLRSMRATTRRSANTYASQCMHAYTRPRPRTWWWRAMASDAEALGEPTDSMTSPPLLAAACIQVAHSMT